MTKTTLNKSVEIDGVIVNVHGGDMAIEEKQQYVKHYRKKYKDKRIESLNFTLVEGGYADVDIRFKPIKFERIRRITGYLVGTLDRFNNAKRAEVEDRVKHM